MKTLQEVQTILGAHRDHLFDHYPIKSMAIFGSVSRRENQNTSDLDVLVEFKEPVGVEFIDLADELEHLVGMKVDLISRNGIQPKYLQAIRDDLVYV